MRAGRKSLNGFGGGFPDGRAHLMRSLQRTLQLLLESRRALWVSGRLYRKYPLPPLYMHTCTH